MQCTYGFYRHDGKNKQRLYKKKLFAVASINNKST